MASDPEAFVGRAPELDEFGSAFAEAVRGRGSAWLIQGEPGIGKSRLCEETARLARDAGMVSAWGRCWEAGGAPAYWPWLQAVRQLLADHPELSGAFRTRAQSLAQILPELEDGAAVPSPSLDPEQARFRLMDAFAQALGEASRASAVLVILEDLHAADASSVALFEFVSRLINTMNVVVVGNLRDTELLGSAVGPGLLRVQRQARVRSLRRLSRAEVDRYLGAIWEGVVDPGLASAVYEATEGHPLFLAETARWLRSAGATASGKVHIPGTVKLTIRERLGKLSAETRDLLRAAATFGRDVPHDALLVLLDVHPSALAEQLEEARERAMLVDVGSDASRFSHVLIQEVLHQDTELAERQRLHLEVARILRRSEQPAPWSVLAHHYLQAGEAGREQGIEAALLAAEEATKQLAFDDAVHFHRLALDALDLSAAADEPRRCRMLLGLGRARLRAGQIDAGQTTCRLATDLARSLGDGEMLAEAALEHATTFVVGEVDPERIELLEEALAALPEGDSGLRSRVMARLAAAMQPALDPEVPMDLARRAIEMARRLADPSTLLATLRSACSALVDIADPEERRRYNLEHVRLAEELGDPVEALRGNMRLVFDSIELGDVVAADAFIEAADRLAARLAHPHYQWGPTALRAMRAAMRGHWSLWQELFDEARGLALRCGDPNARRALAMQRISVLNSRGDHGDAASHVPEAKELVAELVSGHEFGEVLFLATQLQSGGTPPLEDGIMVRLVGRAIATRDRSLVCDAATLSVALGDTEHANQLYDAVSRLPALYMHGGMFELATKGPKSLVLARLARALGRVDEAIRHSREAEAVAAALGAEPDVAWARLELVEALSVAGGGTELARAVASLREDAARLGLSTITARLDAGERPPAGKDRAPSEQVVPAAATWAALGSRFSLQGEGDVWCITCDGTSFRLKDTKGLQILARLIAEPGRPFHALDLVAVSDGSAAPDGGDAGELLDGQARTEYRRRLGELREELEEAVAFQDQGRAGRAREEMEFLEQELARAVGLGQRTRRAGSAAERARVNVQRRIRDAIRRIDGHHPELAKFLGWAVRTGTFCSYQPE